MTMVLSFIFAASSVLGLITLLWMGLRAAWWRPRVLRRWFEKQGIPCLPYRFLVGNLTEMSQMANEARSKPLALHAHDQLGLRILPHFYHFKNVYGGWFVAWFGYKPLIVITNPVHMKEILSNKFSQFRKMKLPPPATDLGGDSVASLEGEEWVQHRRIVSPAFFVEKLKAMTQVMSTCVSQMLDDWESQIGDEGKKEIDVHEQFKILTGDIIAHTAFGSSYEDGKLVFKLQQEQQVLLTKMIRTLYIPGYRFLPTPSNRYAKKLRSQIEDTLMKIIMKREPDQDDDAKDLLGILLAANRKELRGTRKDLSLSMQGIVDECKLFFFAGHETTATLLTWTAMLLSIYPEWQEKARNEVLLQVSADESHLNSYESLHSLKIVGMILNEALRLYPPASSMMRETAKEMELGGVRIPPNTMLLLNVLDAHYNPEFWGPDAPEFKPGRFAEGVANACSTPMAFLPFSAGPRICIGQSFALLEARIILASMLRRFRFSLSPAYKHSPTSILTIQPSHGMQILFEKL